MQQDHDRDSSEHDLLMVPLMMATEDSLTETSVTTNPSGMDPDADETGRSGSAASSSTAAAKTAGGNGSIRSRLQRNKRGSHHHHRGSKSKGSWPRRNNSDGGGASNGTANAAGTNGRLRRVCPGLYTRSTINAMNFLARILFWSSLVAMVAAVIWYSYELFQHG